MPAEEQPPMERVTGIAGHRYTPDPTWADGYHQGFADGYHRGYQIGHSQGHYDCAHGRWEHDTPAHEAAAHGAIERPDWEYDEKGQPIDLNRCANGCVCSPEERHLYHDDDDPETCPECHTAAVHEAIERATGAPCQDPACLATENTDGD